MKILFANKFFYMNGGAERVFFQERDFLTLRGHEVIDFSMQDHRNFPSKHSAFFVPNINYHKDSSLKKRFKQGLCFVHSKTAVKKIEECVIREKPDIAHLHNIYHQLTPSIITVLKKHGVKVVLTLHDYKLICPSYLALNRDQICTKCQGARFFKPILSHCQQSRGRRCF